MWDRRCGFIKPNNFECRLLRSNHANAGHDWEPLRGVGDRLEEVERWIEQRESEEFYSVGDGGKP